MKVSIFKGLDSSILTNRVDQSHVVFRYKVYYVSCYSKPRSHRLPAIELAAACDCRVRDGFVFQLVVASLTDVIPAKLYNPAKDITQTNQI